jgi:hypothetical protein
MALGGPGCMGCVRLREPSGYGTSCAQLDLGWRSLPDSQDMVSKWVAATSVAPHTEEVARSVVDMLMQIADNPIYDNSYPPTFGYG